MRIHKVIALQFFLLLTGSLFAQIPDFAGTFIGGQVAQQTVDMWGAYYFAGASNGNSLNLTGTSFQNTTTSSRGLIVKYNPDKTINWVKRFLNGGENSVSNIYCNSGSQIWITGVFKDSIELDGIWYFNPGVYTFYVARLNPLNGNIIQVEVASSSSDIYVRDIAFITPTEYIVSGMLTGAFSFKGQSFTAPSGFNEIFIIKVGANGNVVWTQTIEGGHDLYLDYSIRFDYNKNMYMVIRASTFQINIDNNYYTHTQQTSASFLHFIIKMNSNANVIWVLDPHVGYGAIGAIETDANGNCYFGGSHGQYSQFGSIIFNFSNLNNRLFFGKIDSGGNYLWVNNYDNQSYSQSHYFTDIKQSSDGSIYFTGSIDDSITIGNHVIAIGTGGFSFLAKSDSTGYIEWVTSSAGTGYSWGSNIFIQNANSVSLTGPLGDNQSWGQFPLIATPNGTGGSYYWLTFNSNAHRLAGKVFLDQNSNGIYDSGDFPVSGISLGITPNPAPIISDIQGNYAQWLLSGNYQIQAPSLAPQYLSATVQPQSITFQGFNQYDTSGIISYTPNGVLHDLSIHTNLVGGRLCFMMESYFNLVYSNQGNTIQSSVVQMVIDTGFQFVQSNPSPDFIIGDTLIWNILNLNPLQSGVIQVELFCVSTRPNDHPMLFKTTIHSNQNDFNPSDNIFIDSFPMTCAYDPNYKTVSYEYIYPDELSTAPWLSYSIHFQNTGTGRADNVMIRDTLSNHLDLSTLKIVASSHPYEFVIDENQVGKFWFHDIMLPDSGTDFLGSMGFVQYRIKPKTYLVPGDSIPNNADIFFDYNDPIRTNNATMHIKWPVYSDALLNSENIKVFPNPATNGSFQIEWVKESTHSQLMIYSIQGDLVYAQELISKPEKKKIQVEDTGLPYGIYFCRLVDNNKTYNFRILFSQ